jgi:hypothetical protein
MKGREKATRGKDQSIGMQIAQQRRAIRRKNEPPQTKLSTSWMKQIN